MPRAKKSTSSDKLVELTRTLSRQVGELEFAGKVAFVYNPYEYARETWEHYLHRYGGRRGVAVLLGMNPGPWGMAQTGIPFGEVSVVRDWLEVDGTIGKPALEHPKRPITGLSCPRKEVSGARLWGWAKDRFGQPDAFFDRFFVWNYCPLAFMVESGANLTPDKLPAAERTPLFEACNDALAGLVSIIEPSMVIGVGKFAETRARQVLPQHVTVNTVLHPSPASPIANRGWAAQADRQLSALGVL